MILKHGVVLTILLICTLGMAGCTGSPQAPVTTPAPLPVATAMPGTPAPAGSGIPVVSYGEGTPEIAVPVVTYGAGTAETAAADSLPSKTLSFHGMADYEDLTFTTDSDATWVFDMTYPKEGIFTVFLKNERGVLVETLADDAGSGSSHRKSLFLKAGNYYFDVSADAPWYITLSTA
jgi:hypothetical protein